MTIKQSSVVHIRRQNMQTTQTQKISIVLNYKDACLFKRAIYTYISNINNHMQIEDSGQVHTHVHTTKSRCFYNTNTVKAAHILLYFLHIIFLICLCEICCTNVTATLNTYTILGSHTVSRTIITYE